MSENVKLVLTLIIGYLLGSISTRVRAQGHPKRGQRQFGHDKHAARDG